MAKRCFNCEEKVKKKFIYCPSCGHSLDGNLKQEDFGMLGQRDNLNSIAGELKLPFGIGKIVNSLVKQLEQQMNNSEIGISGVPKGFKIKVSQGRPQINNNNIDTRPQATFENHIKISSEEVDRRMKLPKVDAESRVRRLGDSIIYEIEAEGVKSNGDVVITKLATGLEIKVYTSDKCYVKIIPLTVEVASYSFRDNKVFVELKN